MSHYNHHQPGIPKSLPCPIPKTIIIPLPMPIPPIPPDPPTPPAVQAAAGEAFVELNMVDTLNIFSLFSTAPSVSTLPLIINTESIGIPLPLIDTTILQNVVQEQVNGVPDSLSPQQSGTYSIDYNVTVAREETLFPATVQFAVAKLTNNVVTTLPNSFLTSSAFLGGGLTPQAAALLTTLDAGDKVYITVSSFESALPSLESSVSLTQANLRIIQIL